MTNIFWLGAHKTGTTFLQKCLDRSQEALQQHGAHYIELGSFRDKYTRPLLSSPAPGPPAPTEFESTAAGTNLIFDENIAGYVQAALSTKGFYPTITDRTRKIADHLGLTIDEVVFGIRDYSGYLPSLYCEILKSTPFQTFDEFLVRSFGEDRRLRTARRAGPPRVTEFNRMNWYDVVDNLARTFPEARVSVYFYENLRGNETRLLQEVLGIPGDRFTPQQKKNERRSFSARAIAELHELSRHQEVTHQDVWSMVRKYRTNRDNPPFAPFTPAEREFLRAAYRFSQHLLAEDPRVEIIDYANSVAAVS